MNRRWHIRAYQEGDEHQILQLRQTVFGDLDPVRARLSTWHWQFRDNPAGKAFCLLAEDHGVVVGQYTAIPTRFYVRGHETTFAFSCDTMIHPDYRKQGMFVTLARDLYQYLESHDQITTVLGFPNRASLRGFTGRLGWHVLAEFPLRIAPIRPLAMLRAFIPWIREQTSASSLVSSRPAPMPMKTNVPGLLIEPIDEFRDSFDELWDRHNGLASVMQVRDSRYLNWRYLGVLGFQYHPFAVSWHGTLSGYIVLRFMNIMGHYFGVLVDLFPFPVVSYELTSSLIRFAREYSKAHRAEFLVCLLPRASDSFLKKAGLKKIPGVFNPRRWYFGCRRPESLKPLLDPIENWYITYGDTDIV